MFIYIKDIDVEGAEFLAPPNSVVVGVKTARTAILEEDLEEDGETEEEGDKPAGDAPAGDASAEKTPAEDAPATE